MKTNKLLSFLTAAAISVSSFAAFAVTASAADSTTYTWDFTDSAFFSKTINADSDIISDQKEETAIMHTNAKLAYNTSSCDKQVAKAEAIIANALTITVPDGAKATLTIELTSGSNGKAIYIKSDTDTVLTADDYTKNIVKEYTTNLKCNTTYYLDDSEYKAYIGKVVLIVTQAEAADEPEASFKDVYSDTENGVKGFTVSYSSDDTETTYTSAVITITNPDNAEQSVSETVDFTAVTASDIVLGIVIYGDNAESVNALKSDNISIELK